MSQLYVTKNNVNIGIDQGRIHVKSKMETLQSLPIEKVEGITIFGQAQLSTRCLGECLSRGIPIQYYSSKGAYFGKLTSTQHVNTKRQRAQIKLTEDEDFVTEIQRRILNVKLQNQAVLLRRYHRHVEVDVTEQVYMILSAANSINKASSLAEMMGYEGNAAKEYFKGLNLLITNPDFKFDKRARRPPKDEFNSMLSMGYALLMNEVYGAIEGRGLSPYFGFIHQDREKHPTLASDLMEEWRPIMVDSVVMSLVNGNEIQVDNFYKDEEMGGVFFDDVGMGIFINKLQKKFQSKTKYLSYVDYPVTFRSAVDLQVLQLCKAIEENSPQLYRPMRIR